MSHLGHQWCSDFKNQQNPNKHSSLLLTEKSTLYYQAFLPMSHLGHQQVLRLPQEPVQNPTSTPSLLPTTVPSLEPSGVPSDEPSRSPTGAPTSQKNQCRIQTSSPSLLPTKSSAILEYQAFLPMSHPGHQQVLRLPQEPSRTSQAPVPAPDYSAIFGATSGVPLDTAPSPTGDPTSRTSAESNKFHLAPDYSAIFGAISVPSDEPSYYQYRKPISRRLPPMIGSAAQVLSSGPRFLQHSCLPLVPRSKASSSRQKLTDVPSQAPSNSPTISGSSPTASPFPLLQMMPSVPTSTVRRSIIITPVLVK